MTGLEELIRAETRSILASSLLLNDPADINGGYCRRLAEAVIAEYGGDAAMYRAWSGMGSRHYFIEHGGRYYDATRPSGVERPSELPFFNGEPPESMERVRVDGETAGDVGTVMDDLGF